MTLKRARKLIKKCTTEIVNTTDEGKIDRIERKVHILRDFIVFEINDF